jgi:hypothetical protein
MPWSSANATALIKSIYTPILTAQLLPGSKGKYVIGYGRQDGKVKKGQVINQTQADAYLDNDLKKAAGCIKALWEKAKGILADYQNTALVSVAQSQPSCDNLEKFWKKNRLPTKTTVTTDVLNAYFLSLIASLDKSVTSPSAEFTARRAAEKVLFGIV